MVKKSKKKEQLNLKDYLRPTKHKVLTSLLLILISIFIIPLTLFGIIAINFDTLVSESFGLVLRPIFFASYYSIMFFINTSFYLSVFFPIIFLILISYPFACYINKNKKWLKGVVIYLIVFVFVTAGTIVGIEGYNKFFGHSCKVDSDCRYLGQAVNNQYIQLYHPLGGLGDRPRFFAVCENNQCKPYNPRDATSVEDCKRATRNEYDMEVCLRLMS